MKSFHIKDDHIEHPSIPRFTQNNNNGNNIYKNNNDINKNNIPRSKNQRQTI